MSNKPKPKFEFSEKVAEAFKGAPTGGAGGLEAFLGVSIVDVGPGTMHGQIEVREDLMTRIGNMHGGVLSAFCDHMLGCVCYPAMKKGQWAATTEFKINLTAPVTKGVVEARAEIINLSRTQAVVRIDVRNEDRLAATAQALHLAGRPR